MSRTADSHRPSIADGKSAEVYERAANLFVEKGYNGTSITDLARAVGLTKAGLYYYINSKQDLLYRILDYAMGLVESTVIEPIIDVTDPEERARQFIRRQTRMLLEHGVAAAILLREKRNLEPENRDKFLARLEVYNDFVRGITQQLRDEGKLREMNVTIAAKHMIGAILEIARWYPPEFETNNDEIVEDTTTFIMGGLLKGKDM